MCSKRIAKHRQRGAVAIMIAVSIVVLVAMLGMVLDIGHLYIVKTELQNAADACALSAAQELSVINGTTLDRATNAGIQVGSRNSVNFQSNTVVIQDSNVTFSPTLTPGSFSRTITGGGDYVRCAPYDNNGFSVTMWFIGVLGILSGAPVNSVDMGAEAYAKLGPRQSGGSPVATLAG